MRILLTGNSEANKALSRYFSSDDKNIVFSTMPDTTAQALDIAEDNSQELKEFALANEINLTILCSHNTIVSDISKEFQEAGLSVFAPEGNCVRIFDSKCWAKRFIYRNKILTPKFQIFEKPQLAIDYVRQNPLPAVIKPDRHSDISTRIVETFGSAKAAIEEFFDTGSKKILIEEYIRGKEFSIYVISDGYNPVVLCDLAVYQNSVAKLGADFLDDNMRRNIFNNVLVPAITSLAKETGEYTGILGFDFILSKGRVYLLECNPFFKDLDASIVISSIKDDWAKILESALSGTLKEEFGTLNTSNRHFYSAQIFENGCKVILSASGRTANEAKELIVEEGLDKKELDEALKIWKY